MNKDLYPYKLTVDLNVIEHLGEGLYSSTPAVISELVANAYDADAEHVEITLSEDEISIHDDGCGMSPKEVNDRFLTVGYKKRIKEAALTPKGRKPMGRKGIGKLSVFAISGVVEVRSVKEVSGEKAALIMRLSDIKKKAQQHSDYFTEHGDKDAIDFPRGTSLILTQLKRKRVMDELGLRRSLARRFSILGQKFQISINGTPISIEDRGYWEKIQFLWGFGSAAEVEKVALRHKNVVHHDVLSNQVKVGQSTRRIEGWIGTVRYPRDLKSVGIDSNNVVVMARGRVIHENLLPYVTEARIFQEYVVGEIRADWLDDSLEDIATSSRQSIQQDDEQFAALQTFLKEKFSEIAKGWDELRKDAGAKEAVRDHPKLVEWIDNLSLDQQKTARRLIGTIQGMPISNETDRKELLKHGIMAFETLSLNGNIAAIEGIQSPDWDKVRGIFRGLADLEAAHYYQIAKSRLAVLKTFERLVDEGEKEKAVQQHLFNNLWLLDASWERATENARMEKRFVDDLTGQKLGIDQNDALSRFDIKWRSVAGKTVIVELKRGDRKLHIDELSEQVRKYSAIIENLLLSEEPNKTPHYDIICVLSDYPTGYDLNRTRNEKALDAYNARILPFEHLISRATHSYGDLISRQKEIARLEKLIEEI